MWHWLSKAYILFCLSYSKIVNLFAFPWNAIFRTMLLKNHEEYQIYWTWIIDDQTWFVHQDWKLYSFFFKGVHKTKAIVKSLRNYLKLDSKNWVELPFSLFIQFVRRICQESQSLPPCYYWAQEMTCAKSNQKQISGPGQQKHYSPLTITALLHSV